MRGKMTIIDVDGHFTETELTATPTLDELRAAVGGDIELVPLIDRFNGRPCVVFCNEDGKIDGLEPNPAAQALWCLAVGPALDDFLVGPVAIVSGDEAILRDL